MINADTVDNWEDAGRYADLSAIMICGPGANPVFEEELHCHMSQARKYFIRGDLNTAEILTNILPGELQQVRGEAGGVVQGEY